MEHVDLHSHEKYCVVCQGTSWFAIPAMSVREICARPPMTPIPGAQRVLAGICHVRNEFLPVLRLCCLVAADESSDTNEQLVLVMTGHNGPWALAVDKVAGLESLEASIDTDVRLDDGGSSVVIGSATYRDHVVRVLDPKGAYRFAERVLEDASVLETG